MSNMSHKNIVTLVAICSQPLCMILEFCNNGNLYDWIRHDSHKITTPLSDEDFIVRENFALDIAKGMAYLHSTTPPIIHRDLKSPNVLLTTDPNNNNTLIAKIADFGLSRGLVWAENLVGKVVDNPIWLAPEVLIGAPYNEKVDVYAFGIIMWELISGKDFMGDDTFMSRIEERIISGEREKFPKNLKIPSYYEILVKQCWDPDPMARPPFENCIKTIEARDDSHLLVIEPNKVNYFVGAFVKIRKKTSFTLGDSRKKKE